MARGDDVLNLIIALTDMIGSIAKNSKKILAIRRFWQLSGRKERA